MILDVLALRAVATSLVFVRVGVALRLTPFLAGSPLPWIPWAALSAALAVLVAPLAGPVESLPDTSSGWLAAAAGEALVGAVLGLLARIVFSVVESTGGLLRIAGLAVPEAGAEGRGLSFSAAWAFVGTCAFLLVGGHRGLFSGIVGSYRCLPVGGAEIAAGADHLARAADSALVLFSSAMAWAVMVASPVFAAGLVADLVAGLLERVAPSLERGSVGGAVRVAAVQLALIAVLGAAVSASVGFLSSGIEELSPCR